MCTEMLESECAAFPGSFQGPGTLCSDITCCSADTDGNMDVNVVDLVNVILDWGTDGSANGGDVDGSGIVDVADLDEVILAWGPCE